MKRNNTIHLNVRLAMVVISFFFLIIIIKMLYVAVSDDVDGINLRVFADNRNTEEKTVYASRGSIYDRNGELLATNINSYTLIAYLSSSRTKDESNPQHVVDKEKTARELAKVLNRSEETLLKLLNYENLYQIELARGITEVEKNQIKALDLPGLDFELGYKRNYTLGSYASYIIGYARKNDNDEEITGYMGIEAYYDDMLKGENGKIVYQQDAYGYTLPNTLIQEKEAKNGDDIYLTLESDIQLVLENAISNLVTTSDLKWATISVMDAKTGAIVGSASSPSFNLNTLVGLESYLNPLISYQYEPGSVMKIFSFMNAIEEGIYDGEKKYMSGTITLNDGTKIKDYNNVGWGEIDYDTGFAYSSNVAATNLALALGANKLKSFYETLGFGAKTGIELSGEVDGKVDFKYESELANASFGQGITVTPIQLLQALSVVANDGVMLKPYIVDKIVDASGNVVLQNGRQEIKKVVSKETTDKVKDLMKKVVYGGLSSNLKYAPESVTLIGKTGTAQIAENGHYLRGEYDYIKSFAGIFPYEDPSYIVYFSVRQLVDSGAKIQNLINNVVEEIAKVKNLTVEVNDVDATKIFTLSNYISQESATLVEDLKQKGMTVYLIGQGSYVINQYPVAGERVLVGNKIFLLSNTGDYIMPDVKGWTSLEIIAFCKLIGLDYNITGYGSVESVSIEANTVIDLTQKLEIKLQN